MLVYGYSEKGKIGYASWQGKNILLNPAHKWMHNCIWDWTQKWYPALMASTVWTNNHQGIIAISSGGTVCLLRHPNPRQKGKKWKLQ